MKSSGQVSIVNIPVATRLLSMQNKHVFVSGEWEGNLRNRAGQVNDVIGPAYSGAKPQMRLPDKERNI